MLPVAFKSWVSLHKITVIELLIIFVAGLVPLLWYRPGFIVSNGDYFPMFVNPQKTVSDSIYLWSPDNLGNPSQMPSLLIYQYIAGSLSFFGLSVGAVETIFQVFFLMGAGFSMYYLVRKLYPNLKLAALLAGIFYMFNFFVLQNRLNVGFTWIYVFEPLLMALLIRALDSAFAGDYKKSNKTVIYLAITSAVAFSFGSINLANIVLLLIPLVLITLYEIVNHRTQLRPLALTLGKIVFVSVPLNLWWVLPFLNVFVFSPHVLNSQLTVSAWSWTQVRSSFLNIFWINGFWAWVPKFYPYFTSYSNPLLIVLVFVPFIVGASSLLFKSNKSRLNACLMLSVLLFVFLAKGLHDPLSGVNFALYQHLPLMNMFREPVSKFTLLIVLVLAPLIGFAGSNLANLKIKRSKGFLGYFVPIFLIAVFIIASYPLVVDPLESKTQQAPYSSYVKIPDYWFNASSWLNHQTGNYNVLLTPLDSFYQVPYTWGFMGMDQFLESLINKPIIATGYLFGTYVLKPETVALLQQLMVAVNTDNTTCFRTLLDIMNVRYILQRNDVNATAENVLNPDQMKIFFAQQPYLHLITSFGQLDVYEYTEAKPSIYLVSPSVFNQSGLSIQTSNSTLEQWNFASPSDIQAWTQATEPYYNNVTMPQMIEDNGSLKVSFWTFLSPLWGLENISSPMVPVTYGLTYTLSANVESNGKFHAFFLVSEYDTNGQSLASSYSSPWTTASGWQTIQLQFTPSSPDTKYVHVEACFNVNSSALLENAWINNVTIASQTPVLLTGGVDNVLNYTTSSAQILQIQSSPVKTELTVNATQPFVIATSQNLDNSWVARYGGKETAPINLYLGMKGFYINETGQFTVTIEYKPQTWFMYLSILAIATAVFCIIFLIYVFFRTSKLSLAGKKTIEPQA
jgi:hypothetical protein